MMDCGVMPFSSLYASWIALRRLVSPMALFHRVGHAVGVENRTALDVARARPMVWISEPAERRKPSLSASRIATSETSGRSSPSRNRLMPINTSNSPLRRPAQNFDAFQGLDLRMHVAAAHADLGVVLGQVFGHALGQRGHQHALVACHARGSHAADRRSGPSPDALSTCGSTSPVGRMICSTTTPADRVSS